MDNVIVNKVASIERCLLRVQEEYAASGSDFKEDYTHQDAAILNLLRACEQSIDLANHIIKEKKLGLVQSSRDSFDLLIQYKLISLPIGKTLKGMVGFRNIAVHNYTKLNVEIVKMIIENHLDDIRSFCREILEIK